MICMGIGVMMVVIIMIMIMGVRMVVTVPLQHLFNLAGPGAFALAKRAS